MSTLYGETRSVVTGTETIEASTQTTATNGRIAVVTIGESGHRITFQGDPEALVALVDRLRAEVVTAVGRAWPVETVHAIPPRQCGVADCPEMATHKSGWLVACEAHAMGRQAENGCKAIPLATTVPALTNRSLG